jgi:hypothetical protein
MANIFDYVRAKEIAAYWEGLGSNKIPYLGATLFPAKKQLGLDLSWLKGSKGLPVSLKPSVFDAKPPLRERIGFDQIVTEMPFFRESMYIGEKERQELNKVLASGNEKAIDMIVRNIYDDATGLIESADVVFERLRMQLLSGGTISITENGVPLSYDYGFDATHKETLTTTSKWSDLDDSDPLGDIKSWQDTIEDDTGVRPTRAICTRKTFNYLLNNAALKTAASNVNILPTEKNIKAIIEEELGVTIAIYNKKYNSSGAATLFFPDDIFTLVPEGTLGYSYYGTTPEESDLMNSPGADVSIVNTGVALATINHNQVPVNVETVVSMIGLPSFESIDQVFIATVHS